jgi:hypothetical protein
LAPEVTHLLDLLAPFVKDRKPTADDRVQLLATWPIPASTRIVASTITSGPK